MPRTTAADRKRQEAVRLSPLEREALTAARDGKNAYDCIKGHYGRTAKSRSRVISDLMRRDLLERIIGPRFGTLTEKGRSALTDLGRSHPALASRG